MHTASRTLVLLLTLAAAGCAPAIPGPAPAEEPAAGRAAPPGAGLAAADSSASGPRRGSIEIVEVYGRRALRAGEAENFRIRLAPGFASPVQYLWDFGDGIASVGNNVTHRFARPGRYDVTVTAWNYVNGDTARVVVTVSPAPAPPSSLPPAHPVAAAKPFRPGDIVWVAGIYPHPDTADDSAGVFTSAGLRAAVLPTHQGADEAYLVAVGGYRSEEEAVQARADVLRARNMPLWLLQLDERDVP